VTDRAGACPGLRQKTKVIRQKWKVRKMIYVNDFLSLQKE